MKILASVLAGAAGGAAAVWLWITYQDSKTNPTPLTDEEE